MRWLEKVSHNQHYCFHEISHPMTNLWGIAELLKNQNDQICLHTAAYTPNEGITGEFTNWSLDVLFLLATESMVK